MELREGKSYGELARKYGYSKSCIRKIERKIMRKRRAMRKAGMTPPEPDAVKAPAFAKPEGGARPQTRPFEQGELFYDGR
jgi:transposase